MSEAGGGIGLGQGLQNWKLVLAGKQFKAGHPDLTYVDLEFLGLKDALQYLIWFWIEKAVVVETEVIFQCI